MLDGLHYEDIKAAIRKKYRTLNAFERANGLPLDSVHDWYRGRKSKRVQRAIERHLASVINPLGNSEQSDPSTGARRNHRLNQEAA